MSATIDFLAKRKAYWQSRQDELEKKSVRNGGKLKRYEMWHLEYFKEPYLTMASDEYIASRFIDHFHNNVRITGGGQISPHYGFSRDDGLLGPIFSHLWLEYQVRGGVPVAVKDEANRQLDKYYLGKRPTGVELFRNQPERIDNVIVKFGKKNHLDEMLRLGRVRLTPAQGYNNASLLKAMRDLETQREFHVPQFAAILEGKDEVEIKGHKARIENGFIKVVIECPEYMLWCGCLDIDRRMPDDFEADSALIIKNPDLFALRMKAAALNLWPNVRSWQGPVTYYDPCSFVAMRLRPETIKHFSFHYQQEWRFCVFPDDVPSEAIYVDLGPLYDIAELVTLPS